MKSHILTAALALPLLTLATPANATTFEFFEGNNCTQKKLGSVDTALHDKRVLPVWNVNLQKNQGIPNALLPFVFWNFGGWNDEARSVRVTSNWRYVPEHRRAQLTVYDSPSGSKSDDWVRVIVDDVQRIPEAGVCVGSFERNFNRDGVRLERHPNNGIDGKISLIETICDINCVRDKAGPLAVAAAAAAPEEKPKPKIVIARSGEKRKIRIGKRQPKPGGSNTQIERRKLSD